MRFPKAGKVDFSPDILRIIKDTHKSQIVLGCFSQVLFLIATCGRQPLVRIWDFEKVALEFELSCTNQLGALIFLQPYPLLLGADQKGYLLLWALPPHNKGKQLLVCWKNMFTIQRASPATCLSHKQIDGDLVIFVGDDSGYIRLLSLGEVLSRTESNGEIKDSLSLNKNPYRIEDRVFEDIEERADPLKPLYQVQKHVKQIRLFKAHSKRIQDLQFIDTGKSLAIVSLGADILVKLWTLEGQCLGILRQGMNLSRGWGLSFVGDGRAEVQLRQLVTKVKKGLPQLQRLHRSKLVPFSQLDDDPVLSRVDSRDILSNLKEVDEILNRQKKLKK